MCVTSFADPNSFANHDVAAVSHMSLRLTADFATKMLTGFVDITVDVLKDDTKTVVLDTKDLTITSVTSFEGDTLKHTMGDKSAEFGQSMTIELPYTMAGTKNVIRIAYVTSPDASALQWLEPSQTAGKKHPYLFSQCQAIHCRSMTPCQDSPGCKTTYDAEITVPAPLRALMSARQGRSTTNAATNTVTYEFRQPVPMPAYLIAIVVGHLEKRDVGPRSSVWSEAEMVEAGAFEFSETEQFIAAAEAIAGPYRWGRYDVLLLPPSFPYGGMENPCLTFVTPTLLAGDRSLANVVAHEIAHSWMGNLVGCRTWEHFWMNEGFTVFLERKIVQSMEGKQAADLHAMIGWEALKRSVNAFGETHDYTKLCPKLTGVDPDDAFSSVPYEKGFNFLVYLQSLVGGESVMNPFLRAHCERFKFSTTTSTEWKAFFLDYMANTAKVPAATLEQIDWDAWFHSVGYPPVKNEFDRTLADAAMALATSIVDAAAGGADAAALTTVMKAQDLSTWMSAQIVVFLDALTTGQAAQLTAAGDDAAAVAKVHANWQTVVTTLDACYKFGASKNSEQVFRFLTLGIRCELESVHAGAVTMLTSQGRMKFVRPLYRDLGASKTGAALARSTFAAHKTSYHSICQKMVAKDLA